MLVGLERERGSCRAFFLWIDWRVWRGGELYQTFSVVSIGKSTIRFLVRCELQVLMVFYAWNDFEVRSQNINWLTSLAEITILLQLANVSPCCFCCIGTMKNALKQFLIIWSWRQFNFYHDYEVERFSKGRQLFILKGKKIVLILLIYLFLSHYRL